MTLTTFTGYGITRFIPGAEVFAIQHTDTKYWAVVVAMVRASAPDEETPPNSIETLDQRGPFETWQEAQQAADEIAGRVPPP